ncbi:MAG: MBL fold metallo-hydrolase [Thermoplasmataceae archaeon]
MFEPIAKNVFRWGTIDGESGIMMYSHLLLKDGKIVLIDPLAMPGLNQMIKILGEPVAIIMTNHSHIRGSSLISRQMGIPLYIPDIAAVSEDEKIANMFFDLYNMKHGEQYKESTNLPFGIRAYSIPNRHEMAIKFDDYLIVGDSAYGINGKLCFSPYGLLWPDPRGEKALATSEAVIPIIRKTGAKGLLSGHMEDIASGLQEMI